MRKNQIKGGEINQVFAMLIDNVKLKFLDLKDNDLDDKCAALIRDLLSVNYFIEDLVLDGNKRVCQIEQKNIDEEIRKNLLIKNYIFPLL